MADDLDYTTLTRYIHVDAFISMIQRDIQKLIREYGHINCGLRHEELCTELKKFINKTKTPILSIMDEDGKKEWNSEWSRKRNNFFNRLFEEEGFKNMCYPPKKIGNPSLYQLKSKHIQFCKERDVRKATVEANPVFSECVKYNQWIMSETKELTLEFLRNVHISKLPTVKKYFSTKEHPGGHDPREIYPKSKLDCRLYNPPPGSNTKIPVEKKPTNKQQPSMEPKSIPGYQGKDGGSVPYKDSGNAETKSKENITPKSKSHTPDFHIPSQSETHTVGTSTFQDTSAKTEDASSLVNKNSENKESISIQGQYPTNIPPIAQGKSPPQAASLSPHPKDTKLTHAISSVPEPNATISLSSSLFTVQNTISSQTPATTSSLTMTSPSSLNLGLPSPSDPLSAAAVTNGQDRTLHSTTTSDKLATKHSTKTIPAPSDVVSSLAPSQFPTKSTPPAVASAQGPATPESSSASTVTTTSAGPDSVTISNMSTIRQPILSAKEATSASSSEEPPPPSAASRPKATGPTTDKGSQQAVINAGTSLGGRDNGGISVPTQPDRDSGTKSPEAALTKPKGKIQKADEPLSKETKQTLVHSSGTNVAIQDNSPQKTPYNTNQPIKPTAINNPPGIGIISSESNISAASVNTVKVKIGTTSKDGTTVRNKKNDNYNIEPEGLPPLINIIPIILIILTSMTALFLLYKYTPFGFLLGRRRKRKKRDLRSTFVIPEESTYESPNIALHEWEDHNLLEQTVENDVYSKLLKINRYKQEMQKKKKENKKTLIEVHMEVIEEYKNDEWELHKGDFLEICLRGFINDENDFYSNFPNLKITINNINEKTIEYIQKQEILWNNWIEDYRNILEQWKKEDWFHILKNKWKNEEQKYKEKNDKLQVKILNEEETYSIVSQKDMWKQWISKQAALIDMFNKEDWFKSIIYAQDKEKDNSRINEYNNTSITSKTELKNEKCNHEYCRSKDIIQKLMVQIHMMVLEECIKEEMIRQKELCIDNFIEDIHTQNNYDEKRNITQCNTHDFNALEFEKIHTIQK